MSEKPEAGSIPPAGAEPKTQGVGERKVGAWVCNFCGVIERLERVECLERETKCWNCGIGVMAFSLSLAETQQFNALPLFYDAHSADLVVRRNGRDEHYQVDWIKTLRLASGPRDDGAAPPPFPDLPNGTPLACGHVMGDMLCKESCGPSKAAPPPPSAPPEPEARDKAIAFFKLVGPAPSTVLSVGPPLEPAPTSAEPGRAEGEPGPFVCGLSGCCNTKPHVHLTDTSMGSASVYAPDLAARLSKLESAALSVEEVAAVKAIILAHTDVEGVDGLDLDRAAANACHRAVSAARVAGKGGGKP